MCTAVYTGGLFGRTLDLEYSLNEEIVLTPRRYNFDFLYAPRATEHYAIIGTAHVSGNTPLYYDGINEAGVGVAALNFPGCATYHEPRDNGYNIASFELIPWILSRCESVDSAEKLLSDTTITDDSFSVALSSTPLHWMIADRNRAITVESTENGLQIHRNEVGVMTNSPFFDYHMTKLSEYMHLDAKNSDNSLCRGVNLTAYSRGMGAIGLPGDWSSSSRFVRAVYALNHTESGGGVEDKISKFFHIMDTVSVPDSCVKTDEGINVRTVYTSCGDLSLGEYYYTTYGCRRIACVGIRDFSLDGNKLVRVKMNGKEDIYREMKK